MAIMEKSDWSMMNSGQGQCLKKNGLETAVSVTDLGTVSPQLGTLKEILVVTGIAVKVVMEMIKFVERKITRDPGKDLQLKMLL
jgi:hypothetical protein